MDQSPTGCRMAGSGAMQPGPLPNVFALGCRVRTLLGTLELSRAACGGDALQRCLLSPFLFNFVIDEKMRRTLEDIHNPGVYIVPSKNLVADNVIFEESGRTQALVNKLANTATRFAKRIAPARLGHPGIISALLLPPNSIVTRRRKGIKGVLSPFLFNFDMLLEISLPVSETSGVEMLPGRSLSNIEYVDDIALLGSDFFQMQTILSNLNYSVARFGMRFTSAKCKVLLQDWVGSNPHLMLAGEPIDVVNKFVYLDSCMSCGGLVGYTNISRIGKTRVAFANLRHLWRRRDGSLSVKGGAYIACDPYCFVDQRLGSYAQKTYGRCQCLITGVSAALVRSGENIGLAILR
ncbi:hypothetical protein T265_10433 [Opisthorchis viverrini]|uniref:Reverse transcriptase domain-containing protein n=1 Tax=Opisthorchis viverrini TaxID=6198 RepID=A0A074Z2J6_OPIVI|nr:hypothetical protein T265_10433 [Opisthorchis viverrini]KER21178.1 hypothetical protein T265_10433 [Opisthorchis viverrini]